MDYSHYNANYNVRIKLMGLFRAISLFYSNSNTSQQRLGRRMVIAWIEQTQLPKSASLYYIISFSNYTGWPNNLFDHYKNLSPQECIIFSQKKYFILI